LLITLLPLLPLPLPLLPSPLQPHLPLPSIKLLPRLLQLPIHLQQLLHPPQHLGALPDRKQEIINLHLLAPRVVRRVRSDVACLDDEVGDDLIEDTDGFGEGDLVVAEGVEEGFHCDEGMLAEVEGRGVDWEVSSVLSPGKLSCPLWRAARARGSVILRLLVLASTSSTSKAGS